MSKQVPTTKRTENEGILAVASFANEIGWAWRPTPNDDYGFDGELEPIDEDNVPTGRILKVQIKSGASYLKCESDDGFYFLASQNDLEYWDGANVPVLLVVHDPRSGRTFCADVHAKLRADTKIRRTRRIPFDKRRDVLANNRRIELTAVANDEEFTGRIFRHPSSQYSETLESNLLPARRLPRHIFGAPSECRTQQDVRVALGDRRKTPAVPLDGMIWTFADLESPDCSLRAICDTSKIQRVNRKDWQGDEVLQRKLVQVLNVTLRKMLCARKLVFDRRHGRYYFPPEDRGIREQTWQSLRKKQTRPVVYPHFGGGDIDYWVHWGARFRYMFFGRHCYLCVEPCMVFTRDGIVSVGSEEMGRLSTQRASHCYNRNVLGFLYFWKEFLSDGRASIVVFPPHSAQRLEFWASYVSGKANFGIEGDQIAVKEIVGDLDEVDLSLDDDVELEEEFYGEFDERSDDDDANTGEIASEKS